MAKNNFDTPVLLLIFNRPGHTRQLIDSLRAIKPVKIFVSADGPRPGKEGEAAICAATRATLAEIDWECTVTTNFFPENLGCRLGVSGGITWFFGQVPEGIILEDDCLCDPSFFYFAEELLERYRHEPRVMMIGSNNPADAFFRNRTESYVFTKFAFIWGWASWRRAWELYDLEMNELDRFKRPFYKSGFLRNRWAYDYLWEKFRVSKTGANNTWDFQWFYSILKNNGLSIMPVVNLVENTGFGEQATHTDAVMSARRQNEKKALAFPIHDPQDLVETGRGVNQEIFYRVYKSRWGLWLWKMKRLLN